MKNNIGSFKFNLSKYDYNKIYINYKTKENGYIEIKYKK